MKGVSCLWINGGFKGKIPWRFMYRMLEQVEHDYGGNMLNEPRQQIPGERFTRDRRRRYCKLTYMALALIFAAG